MSSERRILATVRRPGAATALLGALLADLSLGGLWTACGPDGACRAVLTPGAFALLASGLLLLALGLALATRPSRSEPAARDARGATEG